MTNPAHWISCTGPWKIIITINLACAASWISKAVKPGREGKVIFNTFFFLRRNSTSCALVANNGYYMYVIQVELEFNFHKMIRRLDKLRKKITQERNGIFRESIRVSETVTSSHSTYVWHNIKQLTLQTSNSRPLYTLAFLASCFTIIRKVRNGQSHCSCQIVTWFDQYISLIGKLVGQYISTISC